MNTWDWLPKTEDEWLQFICGLTPIECTNHNRMVYYLDESYVLKLGEELAPSKWNLSYFTNGQNIREAERWERYKDTEIGRYLVPVAAADPEGAWLIMRRVRTLPKDRKVPKELVTLLRTYEDFSDIRTDNCGLLEDDTIALLDYGM